MRHQRRASHNKSAAGASWRITLITSNLCSIHETTILIIVMTRDDKTTVSHLTSICRIEYCHCCHHGSHFRSTESWSVNHDDVKMPRTGKAVVREWESTGWSCLVRRARRLHSENKAGNKRAQPKVLCIKRRRLKPVGSSSSWPLGSRWSRLWTEPWPVCDGQ